MWRFADNHSRPYSYKNCSTYPTGMPALFYNCLNVKHCRVSSTFSLRNQVKIKKAGVSLLRNKFEALQPRCINVQRLTCFPLISITAKLKIANQKKVNFGKFLLYQQSLNQHSWNQVIFHYTNNNAVSITVCCRIYFPLKNASV